MESVEEKDELVEEEREDWRKEKERIRMRRKEWEKTGIVKRKRENYSEQNDSDIKEPELKRKSKMIRMI